MLSLDSARDGGIGGAYLQRFGGGDKRKVKSWMLISSGSVMMGVVRGFGAGQLNKLSACRNETDEKDGRR